MQQSIPENDLSLVVVNGENRVDSRVVAKQLSIEHESFHKTLRTYAQELQELGIFRFEIGEIQGRGQPEKYALLNEDQAIFAATLSRNTSEVVAFKLKLTKAFSAARKQLHASPEQIFTKSVQDRCIRNEKLLKPGVFCVVTEMYREAWTLEAFQKELQPSCLPDGSCGTAWRKYLVREQHPLLDKSYQVHLHVPNRHDLVKVWVYPLELLIVFRSWLRVEYAQHYTVTYAPSRLKSNEIGTPTRKQIVICQSLCPFP